MKDVGEYFDHVQDYWEGCGCSAEPIADSPIFSYEIDQATGKETGRGHLLARITFPGFTESYLHVEDWLRPVRGHIERDYYAYDLIHKGGGLDNWHRHHGNEHRHIGQESVPWPRVTFQEALDMSLEILWSGAVPDF